jgi:hypothetical protein
VVDFPGYRFLSQLGPAPSSNGDDDGEKGTEPCEWKETSCTAAIIDEADRRELKRHSKAKTRVSVISRAMKRTVGALRRQALKLGLGLGHRR